MNRIDSDRMRPIRDEAYLIIRKAIMRGQYKPGQRLQEEHLAKELGISRTPVREALRKLEVEKLVVHYPHKGTVVAGLSLDEIEDLYAIRKLVEVIIAKRAAEKATPDDVAHLEHLLDMEEQSTDPEQVMDYVEAYNAALVDIADCPAISDVGNKVRETLSRMILSGHLTSKRRPGAQQEHRAIVAAIAAGDVALAASLTDTHIERASRIVKTLEGIAPDDDR